jgi:hypothetical protein
MKGSKLTKLLVLAGVLVGLGILSLAAIYILADRPFSIRGSKSFLLSFFRASLGSGAVKSTRSGNYTSIIFLHQSTGRNLVDQGKVRESLTQAGFAFWDHDYNNIGLRDPQGQFSGYSYNVLNDNTNPDGLANIFTQRAYPLPFNTFSGLMQHEVIIIKSCFPNSDIKSAESLEQLKASYLSIRSRMDQYPGKAFIIFTQPPLIPAETSPEAADRARALADWLKSDEFLSGHSNVFVYDFFNLLVEQDPTAPDYNMLRQDYRNGVDSHPNQLANETIGPMFAKFVTGTIQTYRSFAAKP